MSNENKVEVVSIKDNALIIRFDELYKDKPYLAKYNHFQIVKRSYHKKLFLVVDEIKGIIENVDCDYIYNILYFKFNIIETKDASLETVSNFIKEKFFGDKNLVTAINDMVENNYSLNLDSSGTVKNENLQITDKMNKVYLKSAVMTRLLIPIVSTLSDECIKDIKELDKLIFEIFTDCIIFFNDDDYDILQKLSNIVSSRIISTRYSDKDIWEFLKRLNKDINLTIRQFYEYIIVNIFPKIIKDKSIISYVDVVLRKKLNFTFSLDYKINHKTIDHYGENDKKNSSDNLSEMDKFEATLLRKDKGIAFLNDLSIRQKVDSIKRSITDPIYFETFRNTIKFNEFTELFLRIYYKNDFKLILKEEYTTYLLYNMIESLDDNTFKLIKQIVISEEVATRSNNKRKIIDKLSESVKYSLVQEKYSDIADLLSSDKNFIYDIIVKLKSKQFINPFLDEEVELDLDKLNEEVLDFLYL